MIVHVFFVPLNFDVVIIVIVLSAKFVGLKSPFFLPAMYNYIVNTEASKGHITYMCMLCLYKLVLLPRTLECG